MAMKILTNWMLLFLLVYPAALITCYAIDSYTGEMLLVDQVFYGSKRNLLEIIVIDWYRSSLWVIPLMLAAFALKLLLPRSLINLIVLILIGLLCLLAYYEMLPQMLGLVMGYAMLMSLLMRKGVA